MSEAEHRIFKKYKCIYILQEKTIISSLSDEHFVSKNIINYPISTNLDCHEYI